MELGADLLEVNFKPQTVCHNLGRRSAVCICQSSFIFQKVFSICAADCVHIIEMQFLVRDRWAPSVPPEHDGQLLTGDGVIGAEYFAENIL